MAHNFQHFDKYINKVCFFHTLRDAWKLFSCKYSTFLQQIATASLQKAFTNIANQKGIPMLLAIGTCALVLYITHQDWKKYNQSQLGKEKSALLQFIAWQKNFLSNVFSLKMDNLY